MKYKTKKMLLIGSMVAIPVAIVGLTSTIYFVSPNTQRISTKGIFTTRVNENLNTEGYTYDFSATYGSPLETSRLSLLVNNEILHQESEGQFIYDQENGIVVQPSYKSMKFATASALVLTFVDVNLNINDLNEDYLEANPDKCFQLIFDSDDAEIINPPANNKVFVVQKESKNPKSINNFDIFGEIISNGFLASKPDLNDLNVKPDFSEKNYALAGLGVVFNSGAKWVDSNGNETKYDICAKDMFYSIKRTWLYDTTYRRTHGGSADLDSYFITKTNTTKRFTETSKFPNEYLFDFFGIDKAKLYDEKTALQNVYIEGEDGNLKAIKAFTFSLDIFHEDGSINKDTSYSISDILEKYLLNSITFSLAPSQYIDEMYAKEITTPVGKITGEAAKYGIYTYAQTRETTLFASSYIPVYAEAGREIFEYNKHYSNKDWVKSVEEGFEGEDGKIYKTINKVIVEYTNGIESSTFINQSFTSFLNGSLSKIDYSQISDAQKQKLYGSAGSKEEFIKNSQENGLQVTKKVNLSNLTTRMIWQANPIEGENNQYTFNETFSKLVYGSSIDELKKGTANSTNSFYAGYGFAFRLLIQASINWQQYILEAYKGTRDVWLTGAAQNAKFSSTDSDSKTPYDYFDKNLNDLWFYNKNDEIEHVTLSDMKELSSMDGDKMLEQYGDNSDKRRRQSPKFNQIKEAMKHLLDRFYAENNLDSSKDKITWQIAYPFADQDEIKCAATERIVLEVINELDPRIDAKFFKPTTREEMLRAINEYKGVYNANLWSYDYEGIGSYIAAFTSDGGGNNIMNAFAIFAKDVDSDPDTMFQDTTTKVTIERKENNNVITEEVETIVKRPTREVVRKLQEQYPKFTELAKYVRNLLNQSFAKERKIIISETNVEVTLKADENFLVENWDLITNKQNKHIVSYFDVKSTFDSKKTTYTEEEVKTLEKNPWNINPVVELPILFKKFETDASWQSNEDATIRGQGWVDLIQELSHIKGVSIDTESSVDVLTSVNYVLFLREYIIPLSEKGLTWFSNIKYVKEA